VIHFSNLSVIGNVFHQLTETGNEIVK